MHTQTTFRNLQSQFSPLPQWNWPFDSKYTTANHPKWSCAECLTRTFGEMILIISLRKRNLPTSCWNRLPQFFTHASSVYRANIHTSMHQNHMAKTEVSVWVTFVYLYRYWEKVTSILNKTQRSHGCFKLCSHIQTIRTKEDNSLYTYLYTYWSLQEKLYCSGKYNMVFLLPIY